MCELMPVPGLELSGTYALLVRLLSNLGACVVLCKVLDVCAVVKNNVKDMSNVLLCAGSWLRVGCLTVVFFINCVLHCHDLVLHTGSPVRCILSLHCFIVVLVLVLFVCEEMHLCGCFFVAVFLSNLEVVHESGSCGCSRVWGGQGFFNDWWGFKSMSEILLGEIVKSSFR